MLFLTSLAETEVYINTLCESFKNKVTNIYLIAYILGYPIFSFHKHIICLKSKYKHIVYDYSSKFPSRKKRTHRRRIGKENRILLLRVYDQLQQPIEHYIRTHSQGSQTSKLTSIIEN